MPRMTCGIPAYGSLPVLGVGSEKIQEDVTMTTIYNDFPLIHDLMSIRDF
jgi:hypothetical protein